MKTNNFYGCMMVAAMLLASCQQPDVKMHTIIHEDGTCTREVSYSNVMTKEERDSLWGNSTGWSQPMPECLNIDAYSNSHTDVGRGDTVTTSFKRDFGTVEEMSEQSPLQLNGVRLKSKAKLEKHFRWFYTEYTFTETFDCVGNIFKLDATKYADKDVVSFWFTGEPNLLKGLNGAEASQKISEMEPFANKWLKDNLFNVFFDYVVSHYDSIPNPPINKERFCELHDSLSNYLLKDKDELPGVESAEELKSFFHSDAYAMFFNEDTPCGKELNKDLFKLLNIFWFNVSYTLSMPGTVIDTGRGSVNGGIIYYPLTGERLIPHDYTITATSRATHIWAYIVTLLVVLLAVGSFLYRKK